MNCFTKDALPRRRDLLAALGSLGLLSIACNAMGGELGQKYSGQNFSFYYPPEWRLSGNDLGKMASDPDGRYLGIEFLPGSNNRPSWAQLCQSLDDILVARAQKLEREADSINEQRHVVRSKRCRLRSKDHIPATLARLEAGTFAYPRFSIAAALMK